MKALFLCGLAFGILVISSCAPTHLPYTLKMSSKKYGTGIEGRYGSNPFTGRGIIKATGLDGENFTGTFHTVRRYHYNSRVDYLGGQPLQGTAKLTGDRGTIIHCKYEHVYLGGYNDVGFGKCQTNRGDKLDLEF